MSGLTDLVSSPQMRDTLTGLVKQFDQGSLSHADAASHHDQVASKLDDATYQQAAEDAVGKLSPPQREALGNHLKHAAPGQGIDLGSLLGGASPTSSGGIASILGSIRGKQGTGATTSLLGANSGLEGEIGKLVLGGIAAYAAKRALGH